MVKISKILILVLLFSEVAVFGLTSQIFQGAAQEELPIFVKEEPLEKIERPLYVPDEIIVKFKPGIKKEDIENFNRQQETEEKYESPYAHFKVLKIPPAKTVEEMVEIYKKNPNVEYAEPNSICYAFMVPNDPLYPYQWHFDNATYGGIQMQEAWNITSGNSTIVAAVVDTGIAYENYGRKYKIAPDLTSTNFWVNSDEIAGNGIDDDSNGYIDDRNGWDFINSDAHPNDDNSHGTHVAGTVAQSTNNNTGVAGIAFNTSLMPVKVLDKNGSGTAQTVADGIYYAAKNGAKIINMSLGWEPGYDPGTTVYNAVKYAYDHGVVQVAATGNDNASTISYPAKYSEVIAVGATRYDETRTYYSNYGEGIDLVAPGGDLNVDQNEDGYRDGVLQNTFNPTSKVPSDFGYWFFSGTSMSTPHVSGVAALILAQNPTFTPDQVRQRLQTTAEDKGAAGWDQYYGYGIVDAYAALTFGPVVSITVTNNSTFDYGTLPLSSSSATPTKKNTIELGKTPVIKNTGGLAVDLAAKSSDATGGNTPWDLVVAGSIATDKYCHQYSTTTGTTWSDFPISNDYTGIIKTGLLPDATTFLDLQILMPTGSTDIIQKTITVTILATQSP